MSDFVAPYHEEARAHTDQLVTCLKSAETLGDILKLHGETTSQTAMRFLHLDPMDIDPHCEKDDEGSQAYTYAEVLAKAEKAADCLLQHGVSANDKVLLILNTGPAFMATFLGCQLLGAIPVPAVPPYSLNRLDEYLVKTARLAKTSEAVAIVTAQKMVPLLKAASPEQGAKRAFGNLISDAVLMNHNTRLSLAYESKPSDTAMIQFTSGSTGNQKGVVLSHSNLIANIHAIGEGAKFLPSDVCTSWLPLYHDMGLIGHFLAALVWKMPLNIIPPLHFVRRPSSWLRAITKYKGSVQAAPNFAYSLCVKKISGSVLEELDLSSWRVAFCGAEPIDHKTVKAFIEKFSQCGFGPGVFFPVYGMAENSLAITFPPPGREPKFDSIDRKVFEETGVAQHKDGEDGVQVNVSVGSALPRHEIRVVDEAGEVVEEGNLGEIEIIGPSLMSGYYKNPEATAEVIRSDGFYRTGDLGYMRDGELYVTGRRKEMIIKGGRNYFPQDIETAANAVKGVRVGCSAAFGLFNEKRGTEDMVLVCETRLSAEEERQNLMFQIRQKVNEEVGASPDKIVLVPPGSVPKTSSGKIQRRLTRQRFLENDLTPGRKPVLTMARYVMFQAVETVRGLFRSSSNSKRK